MIQPFLTDKFQKAKENKNRNILFVLDWSHF